VGEVNDNPAKFGDEEVSVEEETEVTQLFRKIVGGIVVFRDDLW
jgi:hypothetical protein